MSQSSRWPEVKGIVQGALDLSPEERATYLDQLCGDDTELRQEVEAFLAISSTEADFFDGYTVVPPSMETLVFNEGDELGPYRILRELGKGGMGAVYLTEDREHSRLVALKTVPRHSQRALLHEKRLLASLRHPNIAILFDSGQTEAGLGYFIMEYVEGEPITLYCDRLNLTIRQRLELFLAVCDAVAYAHRKLVVHRDLKPKNILVTAEGEVKLLDFGIAKLLPSEQMLVSSETRSFTVAFASPEQLEGERTTTATDIYSLGVLLCLLLTGRLPYPVKSAADLPWAVRNLAPEKPSLLASKEDEALNADALPTLPSVGPAPIERQLRGDLDHITLHALNKDPDERYSTVGEFAEDIRNFLANRPVSTRNGSRVYRAQKFLRRHAGAISLVTASVLALLAMLTMLFFQYRRALREEQLASMNAERSRQVTRFVVDIFKRTNPYGQESPADSVDELLEQSSRSLENSLHSHPVVRATLLSVLGEMLLERGESQKAKQLLKEALSIQERGSHDRDLAESLHRYGVLLTSEGYYKESEIELMKAQDILGQLDGSPDSTLEARILISRATNKLNQAEYESAQSLYEAALERLRDSPATFPELATSLLGLGKVLDMKDRDEQAEILYRKALAHADSIGDTKNPYVAIVLDTLGTLLYQRGDYASAREAFTRSLNISHVSLGSHSRVYSTTLHNIATIDIEQGNYHAALKKLTESLEIKRRLLPPDHVRILSTRNQIATTLSYMNDYDEAEREFLDVLEIERRVLPSEHPTLGSTINNLAYTYQNMGRLSESRRLFEEALDIFTKLVGRNTRPVATILGNLATIAESQGDTTSAQAFYSEALKIARGIENGKNPEAITIMTNFSSFRIATGDLEAAEDLLDEARSNASTFLEPTDWLTGYIQYMESKLLLVQGDVPSALRKAQQAREILAAQLPARDWKIAAVESVIGSAYARSGRTTEAERLLLESLTLLRQKKGERSMVTQEAQARIYLFYRGLGRYEDASRYRPQRLQMDR